MSWGGHAEGIPFLRAAVCVTSACHSVVRTMNYIGSNKLKGHSYIESPSVHAYPAKEL